MKQDAESRRGKIVEAAKKCSRKGQRDKRRNSSRKGRRDRQRNTAGKAEKTGVDEEIRDQEERRRLKTRV